MSRGSKLWHEVVCGASGDPVGVHPVNPGLPNMSLTTFLWGEADYKEVGRPQQLAF